MKPFERKNNNEIYKEMCEGMKTCVDNTLGEKTLIEKVLKASKSNVCLYWT